MSETESQSRSDRPASLSYNLERLRKDRAVTKRAFAKLLGIGRNTYERYLKGAKCDHKQIRKMARRIKVDPQEFFGLSNYYSVRTQAMRDLIQLSNLLKPKLQDCLHSYAAFLLDRQLADAGVEKDDH